MWEAQSSDCSEYPSMAGKKAIHMEEAVVENTGVGAELF